MASAMKRYLKILFTPKKKARSTEGDGRRITARLPALNDAAFEEDGSGDTVRQAAMERTSKRSAQAVEQPAEAEQQPSEFRLVREICFLHSDVEIP